MFPQHVLFLVSPARSAGAGECVCSCLQNLHEVAVLQANCQQQSHGTITQGQQAANAAHQAALQAAHKAAQQGPLRRQQSLNGAAYLWAGMPPPPVSPQMQQAWNATQEAGHTVCKRRLCWSHHTCGALLPACVQRHKTLTLCICIHNMQFLYWPRPVCTVAQ